MPRNPGSQHAHHMVPKTFKAKRWMVAAIHSLAHAEDITDGEWLRQTVLKALVEKGYDPSNDSNELSEQTESL